MTNEKETGVSRADAQSAAESLFGDSPGDHPVGVAEEENGNNETEQDSQGSEVGEDQVVGEESDPDDSQAAEDETSPQENLKVVMSIKDGRATIGVQQPSSEPHIETVDDPDLPGLAREVLAVVERARAK